MFDFHIFTDKYRADIYRTLNSFLVSISSVCVCVNKFVECLNYLFNNEMITSAVLITG